MMACKRDMVPGHELWYRYKSRRSYTMVYSSMTDTHARNIDIGMLVTVSLLAVVSFLGNTI